MIDEFLARSEVKECKNPQDVAENIAKVKKIKIYIQDSIPHVFRCISRLRNVISTG